MVWGEKSMIFCKLNPTVLTTYQEENWKEINSKNFQQKSILIQVWQICFVLLLQSNVMHQPEFPITIAETGLPRQRWTNKLCSRLAKPLAAESWECAKTRTPFRAPAEPAGVSPEGRSKAESTNGDALHHALKWIAEAQLHPLDPVTTAAN